LIDGGKGQLCAVLDVISSEIADRVSFISLAKENEEIFTTHSASPVVLPKNSQVLQLLQRVRDEAHRFAIGYHRVVREKKHFESLLDKVEGIGTKRKKALIKQFGSLEGIRQASQEQIAKVQCISPELARRIKMAI
ncbi:MAG: helix-hairpin-helix domain-containing protein, partial [Dehalococcoidales bacterium]|nr:helix-hairpin-helix domain-containing protein [Dehalococcoidales bacterium]